MAFKLACLAAIIAVTSAQIISPAYQTIGYKTSAEDGAYIPDNSGAYIPDNSGAYIHQDNPYVHQIGPDGDNGGRYGGRYVQRYITAPQPIIAATQPIIAAPQPVIAIAHHPVAIAVPQPQVVLRTAPATGYYENRNYGIIRKSEDVRPDGYEYLYETENGIYGEEQGQLENPGTEGEAMIVKGFFKYTGPDNQEYQVTYTADKDGFHPSGAHLPENANTQAAPAEYQRAIKK